MKHLLRYIFLFIAFCANIHSWAVSNAQVTVHVVGDNGCGRVGVNYSNTANWQTSLTQEGGFFDINKKFTFYFFAEAYTGYAFKGWYSDEACTSAVNSSATYNEQLTGGGTGTNDYDRYGKFVKVYNSSITVVSTEGGTVSVNGGSSTASITNNESANHSYTLSATPTNGKLFVGWYSDAEHKNLISNESTYTYSLTATHLQANAHTVYAYFAGKLEPNITGDESSTITVDESKVKLFSFANVSNAIPATASNGTNFYFTITNNTPTGAQRHPSHPNEIISYDAANNRITGYNAGTATITFTQNGTDRYEAVQKSFTVTVQKNGNIISLQGYTGNTLSVAYGKQLPIVSTNDATRPEIIVTPISGGEYAAYHANNGSPYIQSNFTKGTAVLKISQAEDYKYKAAEASYTINVAQAEQEIAYVLNDPNEHSLNTIKTGDPFKLSGPGDQLYFDIYHSFAAIEYFHVEYSTDGGNWNDMGIDINDDITTSYKTFGPYTVPEGTTHIRFKTTVGSTLTRTFKNIKITRKLYFNASTNSLDFNVYDGETEQQTFTVDWSISNGGEIKVYSDNPDFTVSPTGFGNGNNADGKNTVTVSYKEAEGSPNTANGHIYVYNDVNCHEIAVSGLTKWKADPNKRYSLQSGSNNITVTGIGDTELMEQKSHLLQAFAFEEQDANKYTVKYNDETGSEQTLYPTVTTIKENGRWKATVGGTIMGDIVEADKYDCTMTIKESALWGTFIAPYRVQIPSGVKAYTCAYSITGDIVVTQHTGSELEANVPYIIYSENPVSQTYSNYGCAAQDAYTVKSLTGTYIDYQTVAGDYVLQKHESGTGFFLVYDVKPTVKPSRCYIAVSPSNKSRAYILSTDDNGNVMMIESIEEARTHDSDTLFTINGIKVTTENPAPGIYIRNGKKVVIPAP